LADRVLEPNDPAYITTLNATPISDAVEEIATEIEWQEGGGVCLFTGQRGTGKSTELRRLKARLEESGVVAFYADLSEYVLLTKPIEICRRSRTSWTIDWCSTTATAATGTTCTRC